MIAGFPMIDVKATLIDGAYHDVDSSALALKLPRALPSAKVSQNAGPKLLEPIMSVEVVTPEDYMGDVSGDLNSRRGQVTGMDSRGNARVVAAMVRWPPCWVCEYFALNEPRSRPIYHAI